MPFRVDLSWNGQPCSIEVMEFDASGKIHSMSAYWSAVNLQLRSEAQACSNASPS